MVKEGRRVLERVCEVQRGRRLVRDFERLLVCRDLAESRDKPWRVTCQERTRRVRQIFALPRDRELGEGRDDRREHRERDRDDSADRGAATAVSAPAAAPEHPPPPPIGEERDGAD